MIPPLATIPRVPHAPIQIVTTFDSLREENAEMKTRVAALKRAQEALQVNTHMQNNMHVELKGGGRGTPGEYIPA